jgi:signal peptide peptidase SppA
MPDLLAALDLPRFHRHADYVGVWAIEPMAGEALLDRARRTDWPAHLRLSAEQPARRAASGPATVKADNGQRVAVVMLTGTLQKAVSSMSDGTSTVDARRQIRQAAQDPDVGAILLAIDSPGGTVAGTADLAADVLAARKSKPVWAFADDLCASAAYWAGASADRLFANDRTALVGSIGTLSVVYDLSGAAEQAGIKALVFGTGPLKGTGAPGAPVTDAQQDYIRGMVEDAQVSFDAAVQKGRSLTDKQLADAKTGGVFGAAEALDRKLIDGIKSFDAVVNDLAAEAKRFQRAANQTRAAGPVPQRSSTMEETTTTTAGAADNLATVKAELDAQLALSRQAAAAELLRQQKIADVCGANRTLAAKAIGENWSVEKAELQAMKESLANGVRATGGPNIVTGVGRHRPGAVELIPGVSVNEALEASVLMTLGRGSACEKQFRPDVLQLARENFPAIGLQQLLLMAAAENGYASHPGQRISGSGQLRDVLRAAFGGGADRRAEGFSTVSLTTILGNIANKELLAGYVEEDMSWKEIAAVKSVSNFYQVTAVRMLDDMEYAEVGPTGEIKHATVGQETYTRQAKTYARMFALTRTHIINDDLGAFGDMRTRIGRGAAKKFNKVFWTAFTNNSSFFTAARTNYTTGATTNLATDGVGLGLAVLAFRKMTTPTGDGTKHVNAATQNPVGGNPGGRPEILLVPPELEGPAEVLYRNQNLGMVSGASANIYANKYRPVVAWQLSDSSYTGFSTTAWYLLNSPGFLPTMVASFLNGNMAPTVDSADADFDQLGVQFRGYHDFGCDQAEYLGGLKSKGAA